MTGKLEKHVILLNQCIETIKKPIIYDKFRLEEILSFISLKNLFHGIFTQ